MVCLDFPFYCGRPVELHIFCVQPLIQHVALPRWFCHQERGTGRYGAPSMFLQRKLLVKRQVFQISFIAAYVGEEFLCILRWSWDPLVLRTCSLDGVFHECGLWRDLLQRNQWNRVCGRPGRGNKMACIQSLEQKIWCPVLSIYNQSCFFLWCGRLGKGDWVRACHYVLGHGLVCAGCMEGDGLDSDNQDHRVCWHPETL